jgi:hypothetical protein
MMGAHILPTKVSSEEKSVAADHYVFDGRNQSGLGVQPGWDTSKGPQKMSGSGNPKYRPRDYTGAGSYGPPSQIGALPNFNPKLGQEPSNLMKGGHAQRSATYDKAVDMVAEGRYSPISQIRVLQRVARDIRPIHGFSRKLYARQFTQPLQDIIGPFRKNRQQSLPGSSQVSIAPHPQTSQPSIRKAGPQTNIPTGMPWNSPMVI